MSADIDKKGALRSEAPEVWLDVQKRFRVVLEEIRSDIETPDSFAIKFSLLTKTPVSKMKHLVNNLPAAIWSGQGKSRADNILALIEEAGGRGSIVEGKESPVVTGPVKNDRHQASCTWCGFPLKEGDTHCDFCMTSVGGVEKGEVHREKSRPARRISPKRLLCYVLVLVVGIIVVIATR